MYQLKKLFNRKAVIGAIHFRPLPGFSGFNNLEQVYQDAKADLSALKQGGVDAVIFENNYDLPHLIQVGPETVSAMTSLVTRLTRFLGLPFGISVLWNDYRASLSIALATGANFVRIPVFVDSVITQYGPVYPEPEQVLAFRRRINADGIALLTDIQVKHSSLVDPKKPLLRSARQAIKAGSDALIITGKWTGRAPDISVVNQLRRQIGSFPIVIGSGVDHYNLSSLLPVADAFIVCTSLKKPAGYSQANIFSADSRIDPAKVFTLIQKRNQVSLIKC